MTVLHGYGRKHAVDNTMRVADLHGKIVGIS